MSQPPLLGSFLSSEGKNANTVKGSANATLNASIVTIGAQNSPCVLFTSTEPTIGPVQLKLTSTSVRARKKIPPSPLRSLFLSALLVHFEGSVISNAPKKLAANTMNIRKNMIFGSQCVESQLNMSAVTPLPPSSQVSPMITHIGTVYSSTMKSPYIEALKRPLAGLSDPFMKKDMVMGTIGNTQGVRSIANPQSMASSTSCQSGSRSAPSCDAAATPAAAGSEGCCETDCCPEEGAAAAPDVPAVPCPADCTGIRGMARDCPAPDM